MQRKNRDTYRKWEDNGQLNDVIEFIKECSRTTVSQLEMCRYLGITEQCFITLKRKYPILEKAQQDAKLDLKKDLVRALYRRAVGYDYTDETQLIEDDGKGKAPKRKITKTKKHLPPDKGSIVYLLVKHFGQEYCDRNIELKLLEKKVENAIETWGSEERENEIEHTNAQD